MNNRPLKFRVWDTELKCFLSVYKGTLSNEKTTSIPLFPNFVTPTEGNLPIDNRRLHKYIVQQFTGSLDKNGVEIFEGDIIYSPKGWMFGSMNMEVYWNYDESSFMVRCTDVNWMFRKEFAENTEVIGNIFENPEMSSST